MGSFLDQIIDDLREHAPKVKALELLGSVTQTSSSGSLRFFMFISLIRQDSGIIFLIQVDIHLVSQKST